MSRHEKDYADDNDSIFEEYAVDGDSLFDEEDEEIGSDFHVRNPIDKPSITASPSNSNTININNKSYEISATKALPAAFSKGAVRGILFLKNGKVVLLK